MKTSPSDPLRLAARALDELERREAYADALLDGLFRRHPGMDPRDRALTTTLVYGVLRWRYRLDLFLETAAARPLRKLDPRLATILRLGAFQLLHLDRTPDAAAVHRTVELAKGERLGHATGLVNAVLRRVARGEAEPPMPADPAERLAFEHSLPPWLARDWIAQLGEEGARALARSASRVPPLYLRVETERLSREEALAALKGARASGLGAYASEAVWAEGAGDPRNLAPVKAGRAVVQGQASQLVSPLLGLRPGMRVLDACAGPGLKTAHLARLLEGKGEIVALDVHEHRARQVEALTRQLGYDIVTAQTCDARTFAPGDGRGFDAVLVDAPCSGLGVLAHAPERKWRADPGDAARLAVLQREILDGASRWVLPGGCLLYATCTTTREENEEVVDRFLASHGDFFLEPVDAAGSLPGEFVTGQGCLRTYPPPGDGDPSRDLDGFFAARMIRRTE